MAWDPEALTERANEVMSIASSRDPQQFPWGVFAWADGPPACGGGVGAFLWFDEQAELLAFLTDLAPAAFMTFDDEAEWLELRERLRRTASFLETKPGGAIADLNAELTSLLQIDWVGRLEQLLSGDSSFAIKVRAGFRSDWDDKPEQVNTSAITDEELQAYLEYLSEYGC
jgi:hypothetical protein